MKSHRIARILVDELLHRCPEISAPFYGYTWPVMNVVFKAKHRITHFLEFTRSCRDYNYHFVQMVIQSGYDLNATDWEGNTILHVVISEVLMEIDAFYNTKDQLMELALKIIEILLENGSYPHARNKNGRCPGEGFPNVKIRNYSPESVVAQFKNLLGKYDSTMTLKYLAARKIVDSQIAYETVLPKDLARFVSLH